MCAGYVPMNEPVNTGNASPRIGPYSNSKKRTVGRAWGGQIQLLILAIYGIFFPKLRSKFGSLALTQKKMPSVLRRFSQCCGSMTFWYGSGSADPCLWLMDPDPAIFVIDLQDASKKLIFFNSFSDFQRKKVKKSIKKPVEMNVCLTIFAWTHGSDESGSATLITEGLNKGALPVQ